jgi:hypothetical protein
MTMRLIASITILLTACSLATARPPDRCLLTSTVTDAKVALSIPDGRKSFREGEIIPLVLSFTSTVGNRYRARVQEHDRSGRLDIETYCLEPEARDPLADYFSTVMSMGGGAVGEQQLSEEPFIATAELNEWRQPRPGHYRLWVVSPRVSRPREASDAPHVIPGVTLRSNTIEFDVIKSDADTLAGRLQEAIATYQSGTPAQENEAARSLRFLSTKESTDALARLFWSRAQPGGRELMFGLWGSPYRTETIAAMQREINSPEHPVTQDFLQTLTRLQIVSDNPGDPATYAGGEQKWRESYRKMEMHERELKKAAITATIAALPQKTGRARALTVLTLATESSDFVDNDTAAHLRRELIADWGDLPEATKRDVIRDAVPRWGNEVSPLAGPEALPIFVDFVSQPAPFDGTRDAALKRIFDLDPAKGRSLILRDLSNPKTQPSISLVKLLPSNELRPAVQQAVQRIVSNDRPVWDTSSVRALDYSIVELFADKSALRSLEAKFKADNDHLIKGMCVPYAVPMLRYFLRVDPKVGAREVQAQLAARKVTGCYPRLLEELGPSLPAVEQLAIRDLDDADVSVSVSAARALELWGTAKAEPALWARLTRFHHEQPKGVDELSVANKDTSARMPAPSLELVLVDSIVRGTNWICGPEKFDRLRTLTSRQNWSELSHWSGEWEEGQPWILTPQYWDPQKEGGLSFSVLQYLALDEDQIRVKLSQLPRGSMLYFQTYTAAQMSQPVSMEKQQALLQGLRKYAAKFGVSIEERPR